MAKIEIPQEIRTAINTLDTAAQTLIDWGEEQSLGYLEDEAAESNNKLEELFLILDDIQLKVTETQEEQEWI
jgi:hypothetical protein